MKREWKITIETTPEGVVKVVADNYNPPGLLSEKEKELLSKVLEPFVIKENVTDIVNLIKKLDDIIDVLNYSDGAEHAQDEIRKIMEELHTKVK